MKNKKIATPRGPLDDSKITSNRFVQAAMLQFIATQLIHPENTDEWSEVAYAVVQDCFKRIGLVEDMLPESLKDMVHEAIMNGSHAVHNTLVAAGHLRTDREEGDRFHKELRKRLVAA